MNPDNLLQLFQKGFRVAIGSAAQIAETVQNPQTTTDTWNRLTQNPSQFAEELAEKGAKTEQEARQVVDRLWQPPNPSEVTITTTATAVTPDVHAELQDLMTQLKVLRSEIAQLRQQRQA
jgi:polyhydroxyalkanoate synthesis regulator phasin